MKPLESNAMPPTSVYAEVTVLVPAMEADFQYQMERLVDVNTWPCFSEEALVFCDALSSALLQNEQTRAKPDIVAFAFWLRKNQLQTMHSEFVDSGGQREALGLVFQIAPGNVDTVFIYSAILSFLLGNVTLVRVSSRMGASAARIIKILNELLALQEYAPCAERFCVVQYPSNDRITQMLSNRCQLRVIWGGDSTIAAIQSLPLEHPLVDVVFPDRYSAALIRTEAVTEDAVSSLIAQFCQDVLPYGQQACSSPRTIYWLGNDADTARARQLFWHELRFATKHVLPSFTDEEIYARELFRQRVALELGMACEITSDGSALTVMTDAAIETLEEIHCGLNTFLETRLDSVAELGARLGDKFQTLTIVGLDQAALEKALTPDQYQLIKRVVPPGQALSFSHRWDGVNLLAAFSHDC